MIWIGWVGYYVEPIKFKRISHEHHVNKVWYIMRWTFLQGHLDTIPCVGGHLYIMYIPLFLHLISKWSSKNSVRLSSSYLWITAKEALRLRNLYNQIKLNNVSIFTMISDSHAVPWSHRQYIHQQGHRTNWWINKKLWPGCWIQSCLCGVLWYVLFLWIYGSTYDLCQVLQRSKG